MFDTVIFKCPNCGKDIEEQTKAGECILRNFNCNEVPINIAIDLFDEVVHCYECGKSYRMTCGSIPPPVTIKMKLIEFDKIKDDKAGI